MKLDMKFVVISGILAFGILIILVNAFDLETDSNLYQTLDLSKNNANKMDKNFLDYGGNQDIQEPIDMSVNDVVKSPDSKSEPGHFSTSTSPDGSGDDSPPIIILGVYPIIYDWSNDITNDQNEVSILIYESIKFTASADQLIDEWNWYIDGDNQNNDFDNLTTSWSNVGIRTVEVNATNGSHTSNTVSWTVTITAPKGPPLNKGRDNAGSDLGGLYGDLFEILRDDINGVPILDGNGCVQPINSSGGYITMDFVDGKCELNPKDENYVIEVHFGRLNLARAPSNVLEFSYDEAIRTINSAEVISIDVSGRFLLTRWDEEEEVYYDKAIDSPLENLALYKKLMLDGHLEGNLGNYDYIKMGDPVAPPTLRPVLDVLHFQNAAKNQGLDHMLQNVNNNRQNEDHISTAAFLAAAADKTGQIEVDMLVYLNTIMGINNDTNGNRILEYDEYFNFSDMTYNRADYYRTEVMVLQEVESGVCDGDDVYDYWVEADVNLFDNVFGGNDANSKWIAGFVQASDDSLRVIDFVHTYQIPELK